MRPLEGVRVLDLTRVVSGPFCTMLLGDLGADVIKVEEPTQGDESRSYGPPFAGSESAYYLSVNRNKRSCAVDLKTAEGVELVTKLAARCDVVIENFRPGTMERLGLSYEELSRSDPRLVYCAITGFGRSGPDAERPGYDLIIQGESGFMDITGDPAGPPTKAGTSIADLVAGGFAVQGILAALLERDRTGRGRRVDVAMLDSMASLLTVNAGMYFTTGRSPTRRGNTHPTIAPYETFPASDGWINLGIANDKFWRLFCHTIGRDDLAREERFARAADRVTHRAELVPIVAEEIARHPRQHWIDVLSAAGVPCGSIRTVEEVCEAPQLVSRGMVLDLPHPTAGTVKNIDSPVRFDDRNDGSDRAPPLLGEHTREVLVSVLGLSDEQVAGLEVRGVVRGGPRHG